MIIVPIKDTFAYGNLKVLSLANLPGLKSGKLIK